MHQKEQNQSACRSDRGFDAEGRMERDVLDDGVGDKRNYDGCCGAADRCDADRRAHMVVEPAVEHERHADHAAEAHADTAQDGARAQEGHAVGQGERREGERGAEHGDEDAPAHMEGGVETIHENRGDHVGEGTQAHDEAAACVADAGEFDQVGLVDRKRGVGKTEAHEHEHEAAGDDDGAVMRFFFDHAGGLSDGAGSGSTLP